MRLLRRRRKGKEEKRGEGKEKEKGSRVSKEVIYRVCSADRYDNLHNTPIEINVPYET